MTEKEFLSKLRVNLGSGVSGSDKREILSDYEEHFRLGLSEGKNENDIARALGDPKSLAKTIRAEVLADRADESSGFGNVSRAVIASVSLGFFNIIFILGPYIGLLGVLVSLWAGAFSIAVSGAASILAVFVEPLVRVFVAYEYSGGIIIRIAAFFIGTFLFSMGSLACIGMVTVTRVFFQGTVRYLKFNQRIITK